MLGKLLHTIKQKLTPPGNRKPYTEDVGVPEQFHGAPHSGEHGGTPNNHGVS